MNSYLVEFEPLKDFGKIASGLGQAIGLLYPDIRLDPSISLNAHPHQMLLIRESSQERIWARLFFEPLMHLSLETLNQDFEEIQNALNEWPMSEKPMKAFVFFPSTTKGVPSFFPHFSSQWHFFKYYFLKSSSEEALAIKEYKNDTDLNLSFLNHSLENFVHAAAPPIHSLQQTSLSREELNEFLELNLELKEYP